jgi:hypothetical protein
VRDLINIVEVNLIPPFTDREDESADGPFVDYEDNPHVHLADLADGWSLEGPTAADIGVDEECFFYLVDPWGSPKAYMQAYCNGPIALVIQLTFVDVDNRQRGLGLMLYQAILDLGFTLTSDSDLTDGSMAIWRKLAQNPKYQVGEKDSHYVASNKMVEEGMSQHPGSTWPRF